MKKYLYLCLVFVMVFSLAAAAGAEDLSGKLVLYSPANEEEYNMIVDAFMDKYPNVVIDTVQGGSGELKTRLESESANPQADVMFGGLTQADAYAYADLWADYVSPNDAGIAPAYQNETGKITMKSVNIQILFVNNELAKEGKLTAEQGKAVLGRLSVLFDEMTAQQALQ